MKTLLEVLDSGTQYLEKQGIDEARLNMQLLLCHILKCDRLALYCNHDRPLAESELAPLREMLRKRGQGIPLQHLTGVTGFYGRDFRTDARALVPRPETETLVETILNRIPAASESPLHVLDVGTGSGIIGITLALEASNRVDVTLSDIQPAALDLARENALALGASVQLVQSDLLAAFSSDGAIPRLQGMKFDVIVANLPYIPDGDKTQLAREVLHDPHSALFGGPNGTEIIERLLVDARACLNPDGLIALEVGHDQGPAVLAMLNQLGYRDTALVSDLAGIARFPIGRL